MNQATQNFRELIDQVTGIPNIDEMAEKLKKEYITAVLQGKTNQVFTFWQIKKAFENAGFSMKSWIDFEAELKELFLKVREEVEDMEGDLKNKYDDPKLKERIQLEGEKNRESAQRDSYEDLKEKFELDEVKQEWKCSQCGWDEFEDYPAPDGPDDFHIMRKCKGCGNIED